jgi:hypothetical protein
LDLNIALVSFKNKAPEFHHAKYGFSESLLSQYGFMGLSPGISVKMFIIKAGTEKILLLNR